MKINVSVVVEKLEQLSPGIEGLHVHGANLNISKTFGYLLSEEWIESLEIFLPPSEFQRSDTLAEIATKILPAWRVGKGNLRFFPIYAIEDVWRDGVERVLLCLDPELMCRDRYLRDKFAKAPTIVSSQTHALGSHSLYEYLSRVSSAPPAPFDAIVCLSEVCRKSLEMSFRTNLKTEDGAPPMRLPIIPNPTDPHRLRPYRPDEKRLARSILQLPEDATIALCLARLTPNSKADLIPLIDAFADVSGPNDLLLCVGPENVVNYSKKLLEHAKSRNLGSRFAIRVGAESLTVPMLYGSADLYVLPSDNIQETFCTSVTEAMAAGLPVLASDWDGIKDTVVHGETGYLVPTYILPGLAQIEALSPAASYMTSLLMVAQNTIVDPDVLREHLAELLRSPETRERLGAAGRKRIEQHFTPATVYEAHRQLWTELLEQARIEDPASASRRKSASDQVGLPVPYRQIFADHGSSTVDANEVSLLLSQQGHEIVQGQRKLEFYDETIPLIRPELLQCLLDLLQKPSTPSWSMAELAGQAASKVNLSDDQALFHLGLLIKRGVVQLQRKRVE